VRSTLSRSEESRAQLANELAQATKSSHDVEEALRDRLRAAELRLADDARRVQNETVLELMSARRFSEFYLILLWIGELCISSQSQNSQFVIF
jgi:hypothetical protein